MNRGVVRFLLIASAVVFLGALLISSSCSYVSPGSVGVLINRTGGGVSDTHLDAGFHLIFPFTEEIEEYPVYMQTLVLSKDANEGAPRNEEINVNSKEGQPISCDVSISFEIDPVKVPALYQQFRQSIDSIAHGFIRQTIRQSMQETIGTTAVIDFLGEKKAEIVSKIQADVSEKLKPYGFVIRQFTLNEVRVSNVIINAIEAKNATAQATLQAQQELKKKEFEAEQKTATAKGDADANEQKARGDAEATRLNAIAETEATKIRADAEAQAIMVKAKAQAEANNLLAKSLTPELIKWQALLQWNGQLPQVTSPNAMPFITLPKGE
jgi:regulator of protease activity HflC (stomatin/prohibitin superfamily)